MSKLEPNSTLRRLRNRYRLVVMNDDTYEEVVTFKLSRLSVYIVLCSIFIILVTLTVSLIVLTPLKEYIPGYGSSGAKRELQVLKMRTDSLEQAVVYKDVYLANLKKVLTGDVQEPTHKNEELTEAEIQKAQSIVAKEKKSKKRRR